MHRNCPAPPLKIKTKILKIMRSFSEGTFKKE
jgi:hypothetical protein